MPVLLRQPARLRHNQMDEAVEVQEEEVDVLYVYDLPFSIRRSTSDARPRHA